VIGFLNFTSVDTVINFNAFCPKFRVMDLNNEPCSSYFGPLTFIEYFWNRLFYYKDIKAGLSFIVRRKMS
jgi:hypothetical protein